MKRFAAIFLLGLLLYNSFGYHLLFAYERQQVRNLAIQITPESFFKVIKIKVALYTSVSDTDFEVVDEELEVDNQTYHIVKKRIKNDTAEMYYFRDFRQEELRKSMHAILTDQMPFHKSGSGSPIKHLLKDFIKDYLPHQEVYVFENCAKQLTPVVTKINTATQSALPSPHLSVASPPPEMV